MISLHYKGLCKKCERKLKCVPTKWLIDLNYTGMKADFNVKECSMFSKVKKS